VLGQNSFLRAHNSKFLARLPDEEDGTRVSQPGKKCVVVLQGEIARLQRQWEPRQLLVGSEDATTCILVVAECSETGILATAHMDKRVTTPEAVAQLLHGMNSPQLYLCGGYCDDRGTGHRLVGLLLQYLHADPRPIEIKLACLGESNTRAGKPLARDLVLDLEHSIPLPVRVSTTTEGEEAPLPALGLRHARLWLTMRSRDGVLFEVYNETMRRISVGPFRYSLDARLAAFLQACLRMPIEQMMQYTSTSPKDERAEFPHVQRVTFKWILEHPEHSSVFAGESSGGFKYLWNEDSGVWIRDLQLPSGPTG